MNDKAPLARSDFETWVYWLRNEKNITSWWQVAFPDIIIHCINHENCQRDQFNPSFSLTASMQWIVQLSCYFCMWESIHFLTAVKMYINSDWTWIQLVLYLLQKYKRKFQRTNAFLDIHVFHYRNVLCRIFVSLINDGLPMYPYAAVTHGLLSTPYIKIKVYFLIYNYWEIFL